MANPKIKFTFCAILWDETGNIQLDRQLVNVTRVNQSSARNYVGRKFDSMWFIELESSRVQLP